jgi:glyoxylase-like metal-dependent hydrolase (beta-lactamase superfamily II)
MDLHVLDRGRIHADLNFALDGEVAAVHGDRNPDLEYAAFAVWNLLVDHPEATVLWDTGSHPDAADGYWPDPLFQAFAHTDAAERDLETALADVGYGLEDVDRVVQSHLHLDHAGGLTHFEGTDVPVYVHRRELEHAYLSAKSPAGDDAYLAADFDRDLEWRVVDRDRYHLLEGFELLHLPGHTPGLLGAHLKREGRSEARPSEHRAGRDDPRGEREGEQDVLVAGDAAFLEANYEDGRSMGASLLYDSRANAASLERVRDLERRHDARVLYGHDPQQFERIRDGL